MSDLKRFTTINDIDMIQCGDYNWQIYKDDYTVKNSDETYELLIDGQEEFISLLYSISKQTLSITQAFIPSDFNVCLKMSFEETPQLVRNLLKGKNGTVGPIYHKDTVKIKEILF